MVFNSLSVRILKRKIKEIKGLEWKKNNKVNFTAALFLILHCVVFHLDFV